MLSVTGTPIICSLCLQVQDSLHRMACCGVCACRQCTETRTLILYSLHLDTGKVACDSCWTVLLLPLLLYRLVTGGEAREGPHCPFCWLPREASNTQ